jgi:F-box and WD-40 domain protein CDC4
MDPPSRPSTLRRTTSTTNFRALQQPDFSPTSNADLMMTSTGEDSSGADYNNASPVADRAWNASADSVASHTTSVQIELADCVETKIVTTTTTTKRSYPPLLVRPPPSLQSLDVKEYPLAMKATPRELSSFSYDIGGKTVQFRENLPMSSQTRVSSD